MVQSVASKEPSNISFNVGGYSHLKIVKNLNEDAPLLRKDFLSNFTSVFILEELEMQMHLIFVPNIQDPYVSNLFENDQNSNPNIVVHNIHEWSWLENKLNYFHRWIGLQMKF